MLFCNFFFLGSFSGHGGSRAAEYLKEHLFDNLMKHPQFLTDTKLAISTLPILPLRFGIMLGRLSCLYCNCFVIFAGESYKQTDTDFLESERDTYRDDGSTASTAVLVGNHLYVANVGDSRTIVSKDGVGKKLHIRTRRSKTPWIHHISRSNWKLSCSSNAALCCCLFIPFDSNPSL